MPLCLFGALNRGHSLKHGRRIPSEQHHNQRDDDGSAQTHSGLGSTSHSSSVIHIRAFASSVKIHTNFSVNLNHTKILTFPVSRIGFPKKYQAKKLNAGALMSVRVEMSFLLSQKCPPKRQTAGEKSL